MTASCRPIGRSRIIADGLVVPIASDDLIAGTIALRATISRFAVARSVIPEVVVRDLRGGVVLLVVELA